MASQTKITLAVLVLLAAVMGLYYTVIVPQDAVGVSESDIHEPTAVEATKSKNAHKPGASNESRRSSRSQREAGGTSNSSERTDAAERSSSSEEPSGARSDRSRLNGGGTGLLSGSVERALRGASTDDDNNRDQNNKSDDGKTSSNDDDAAGESDETARETASGDDGNDTANESDEKQKSSTPQYTTYTVKSGDTMSGIAAQWFGSPNKWHLIAKANPLVDPAQLEVGQELRLPAKDAAEQNESDDEKQATERITYTVKPGDTLSSIALQYYNSSAQWRRIFEANRQTMHNNPDTLSVGMELVIPPPKQTAQADDE